MGKDEDVAASRATNIGKKIELLLASPDSSPELLREFLWRLVDGIKTIVRLQRRAAIVLIGLAIGFELLNRNLIGEFSVSGVKFKELGFLLNVAPLAMSYLILRYAILARDLGVNNSVYAHLACQAFHGLHAAELDRVLVSLEGPATGRPPPAYIPKWHIVGDIAGLLQMVLSLVVPTAFIGYAFWQLVGHGHASSLTWFAAAGSAVCLTLTAGFVVMTVNIDRWSLAREFDFSPRFTALIRRQGKRTL